MSDKTLGKARGLNSIADPSAFKGATGRKKPRTETPTPDHATEKEPERPRTATPQRASEPQEVTDLRPKPKSDTRRKRRELSIPHDIAKALEETSINPADIVLSAYRRNGDAIYAGAGGRPVSRGRSRLRLSLSDRDFDKVVRLGEARGWNRSETVAVLLASELLPETVSISPQEPLNLH